MYFKEDFPYTFEEFIGNNRTTKLLKLLVTNYLEQGREIPHILFYGRPGLGKTTLAEITAATAMMDLTYVIARQLDPEIFYHMMNKVESNKLLFIDEIHGLDKSVSELLFPILQKSIYKYRAGDQTVDINLPYFPIFGATTDVGELPQPFLDRFRYHLILDQYDKDEMAQILDLYLGNYRYDMTEDAKNALIKLAQRTPRLLKNYINAVIDIAQAEYRKEIFLRDVELMMDLLGIEPSGINKVQAKYLEFLRAQIKPVGLNAISQGTGIPEKDLIYKIEPFLLEEGFIRRTAKGRQAI